ncbi:hypothetical protein BKA70DRAFT_1419318 [Coprinopsis sp. MPI-PUGE-AT-0042]|nr:hypothetical protein BKA70DRAFT_1419318 [Coprinopsis sp. MPI-PUGE-AT-0042]
MFEVVRKTLDKFVEAKTPTPGPNLAHRKIIAQDTVSRATRVYPWPNVGPGSAAGVSPGVVIFKDDLDHACLDLPIDQRLVVSVITVAAPRYRKLTPDGEQFNDPSVLEDLRAKIRLVYRMAAQNGQQYLILGAMGCGAYACPPKLVAEEMKSILLEKEFSGWFGKARDV